MTMQLSFQRDHGPAKPLQFDTSDESRIRQHLLNGGLTEEEIRSYLYGWNVINNARRKLNIKD